MKSKFPKRAGGPAMQFLDVFSDLWSDPADVPVTRIHIGEDERMKDMERIGNDIRKAASKVLRDCNTKHD